MKRRSVFIVGNTLMVLGLIVMISGLICSVIDQLLSSNLSGLLSQGAVFAIFIGAMFWLAGARLGGRETVADRYFWLRHYGDKRCRRHYTSH